ncbi:hypothetical protein CRUP_015285 [Coryphaenoides rupestris]|nr:hypothetical protein CRUP_015285 [Coryphaenoides rupestris]
MADAQDCVHVIASKCLLRSQLIDPEARIWQLAGRSYEERTSKMRSRRQVTDMMLQDKLYPDWGRAARKFWKKGNNRIVLFCVV